MSNKSRTVFYTSFFTLTLVIFGIIMAHELKRGDFPQHIAWAREYATNGYLYKIPHTLFAKSVVIVRALLPANFLVRVSVLAKQVYDLKSYDISAWIVMILSYLGTVIILLKRFLTDWSELQNKKKELFAGIAVLIVLLVGPIFLFTIPGRMYFGYIVPNPYHSPTYVLFRPFVLLAFFGMADNLFAKWSWREAFIMALALLCGSLAKPNFTLTILPALSLLILFVYIKKFKKLNWPFLIVPIAITSILVLGSQYIVNYSGDRGDQIIFAPFSAILYLVPNIPSFFLFLFLSIAFPLLVSIFYFKQLKSKITFQLAWINFFVSLSYAMLLGEKFNLGSNNFLWCVMIALFLLFFETISCWFKDFLERGFFKQEVLWKNIALGGTLLLHLACGIIFYLTVLQTAGMWVS